ncbi:AbrB family transcriptional regulator [Alkalicoccus saliphilus]|uniref:AbrB family transcriptional regulator n=1 Tax=Alkalicoccus saliphilus TaxID=200989 RepID=A0A2T4U3Y3_9BACI|nr:AbrB family transcriptional regulator [Alkalicoccus saliphilus]PTL38099.1 hypothetical protein C6Y45_12955 [Alkalicoccus saliphilus]
MKYLLLVLIGSLGGIIGFTTGHPIGPLLGSLLFVSSYQLFTKSLPLLPLNIKRIIQAIIGGSIGLAFTVETVQQFPSLLLPIFLIPFLQLVATVLIAFCLYKWVKIDPITALCGTAPAGMSEMAIISEQYNANISIVATLHLFRILFIVSAIPIILSVL